MAYIRGHFYIWGDGENIHFSHGNHLGQGEGPEGRPQDNTLCVYQENRGPSSVTIPNYIVEEFVAMHWARMTSEEREAAVGRVVQKYGGGNFGADAIMEAAKMPTVMDAVMARFPEKFKDEAEEETTTP